MFISFFVALILSFFIYFTFTASLFTQTFFLQLLHSSHVVFFEELL